MSNKFKEEQGICPVCNSDNLEYGTWLYSGNQTGIPWECEDCKSRGQEWYTLTFIGHENIQVKEVNKMTPNNEDAVREYSEVMDDINETLDTDQENYDELEKNVQETYDEVQETNEEDSN